MSRTLTFWMALLFVFGGAMVIVFANRNRTPESFSTSVAKPPVKYSLEDGFQMTDQTGTEFDSKSLDGKIWIGSIFFSQCPSTCRIQNMRVAELQKRFGDKGVEFVSITCDPENDTVAALKDYSKTFDAESDKWHFLTGDLDLIKQVGGEKFGITVDDKVHSDRLILFGKDGGLIGTYRSLEAKQFAELIDEVSLLLGESPTTEANDEAPGTDVAPTAEEASASDDASDEAAATTSHESASDGQPETPTLGDPSKGAK